MLLRGLVSGVMGWHEMIQAMERNSGNLSVGRVLFGQCYSFIMYGLTAVSRRNVVLCG